MNVLYFFYGNNLNSILDRIHKISNILVAANNTPVKIEKYDLENKEECILFLNKENTFPLFSESAILVINLSNKSFNFLENNLELFVKCIKFHLNYKTIVLVMSLDPFSKTLKTQIIESDLLKKLNDVIKVEEFNKLRHWQKDLIKREIAELGHKYNLQFEQQALNLFVEYLKDNLDTLEQEFKKIHLYLLPENIVNKKIIHEMYFKNVDIDDLYESLIVQNNEKHNNINATIQNLKNSKNSLYLIAALQNKLRKSLEILLCLNENVNVYQISKRIGIGTFVLEKQITQLRNTSIKHLENIIFKLSEVEFKVKSGIIDESYALENVSICAL